MEEEEGEDKVTVGLGAVGTIMGTADIVDSILDDTGESWETNVEDWGRETLIGGCGVDKYWETLIWGWGKVAVDWDRVLRYRNIEVGEELDNGEKVGDVMRKAGFLTWWDILMVGKRSPSKGVEIWIGPKDGHQKIN